MKGRNKNKRIRKFDWGKFLFKFAIRLSYRLMELVILIGIGAMLGLKLVKY